MVAVIHSGTSFRRAVHYNENKVKEGKAQCLAAVNYPKDPDDLTVTQKINRLQHQAKLNERTTVNCVHISLNFDPFEKLSPEKIIEIARAYMEKIGFGDQPYLIYQHWDAGHPHIHVVTTNIKADGKRIPLHNIGRDKSEPARQQVEKEFDLVRASDRQPKNPYTLQPVKVQYGKTETKRAVTHVVNHVLNNYKFTSLEEFNAVLKNYNAKAERGQLGSRTYERGGLVYRVLDEQGKTVGTPIKASDIYTKPTLKKLENKYESNVAARKSHRQRIRTTVDWTLHGNPMTLDRLANVLEKENIQVIVRANAAGRIYGITYIDHKTQCVFNGSDLGKEYTAHGIQNRCATAQTLSRSVPHQQIVQQEFAVDQHGSTLLTVPQWHLQHASNDIASSAMSGPSRKKKKKTLQIIN